MTLRVVPSVGVVELSPRRVETEFRGLIAAGAAILPAGRARSRPTQLLSLGYAPKYKITLFDTDYYVTNVRQNPDIRFFVAYVAIPRAGKPTPALYPRIFYKDVSLVWRSASHFVRSESENWVGKGAVKPALDADGEEIFASAEETTDLPLEIQSALESLVRRVKRPRRDERAMALVLRKGPDDRIEPYRDFSEPRRIANSDPRQRINRGRPIARFSRRGDPSSLVFVSGYAPDFARGIIEVSESSSRLYGGRLTRYRIVSVNRKVQYLFFAGPEMVWIVPPQATSTELSSYGVRPIDVEAPEELSMPGYEYHFIDESEDPPELVSQIPAGFVGPISELDESRCATSPWLDRMPVIRDFRRKVLAGSRKKLTYRD
jgi:hypothetical protein